MADLHIEKFLFKEVLKNAFRPKQRKQLVGALMSQYVIASVSPVRYAGKTDLGGKTSERQKRLMLLSMLGRTKSLALGLDLYFGVFLYYFVAKVRRSIK